MSPLRAVSISLVLALAAACESPTGITDGIVRVTHESGNLVIRNASAEFLGYAVIPQSTSFEIDWGPCAGLGCPTIPPYGSVTRPDSTIYSPTVSSPNLFVYWWRAEPNSAAPIAPDAIHRLVVPL